MSDWLKRFRVGNHEYYKATATLESVFVRRFKTKAGAQRWLEKIEAKLTAANKLADGEIWTNIELMYLCRWDCPTTRLAAAQLNTSAIQ